MFSLSDDSRYKALAERFPDFQITSSVVSAERCFFRLVLPNGQQVDVSSDEPVSDSHGRFFVLLEAKLEKCAGL